MHMLKKLLHVGGWDCVSEVHNVAEGSDEEPSVDMDTSSMLHVTQTWQGLNDGAIFV